MGGGARRVSEDAVLGMDRGIQGRLLESISPFKIVVN